MNAQARADFVQADAELNKTYEALLTKLPDVGSKEKLKQSQRVWLAFRDAEAASAAAQTGGGSMAPPSATKPRQNSLNSESNS